jgi:putative membrane protein (TIGR04086 family)
MSSFDRRVVVSGAVSGLFFALPAAVLQRTIFDSGAAFYLMLAVVFFSGALAGYGAARPLPPKPLHHGAAAGVITFVGAESVYVIAARSVPNPVGLIFFGLLFASLGIIGAYVAVATGARRTGAGR